MHVLGVAGIHDGYGIAIDGVGKIPLVGVGHVVVAPALQCGRAPKQRPLNLIHGEHSVLHIAFQILLVVSMTVLFRHVAVKREDFPRRTTLNNIFIISHLHRSRQFPQKSAHTIVLVSNPF